MRTSYRIGTMLVVTFLIMGMGYIFADSLTGEYELSYNYKEQWDTFKLNSITLTTDEGHAFCTNSFFAQSRCDIIIIKQNERIIDLLEYQICIDSNKPNKIFGTNSLKKMIMDNCSEMP
jgi:hypothetical protein